jgi:very-short-patch-repair endonuclease
VEGSLDHGRATEPYARPQTERDKAHNRRQERAEERKSDVRRGRPSIPEQQMIGLLAVLGERYNADYYHEAKIKDGDWYISHVDFAWPQNRRILEVYGGPHYKPELDRTGARHEEDARRIATLETVGWDVLIVFDFEISRDTWPTVIKKVERFLRQGSVREREDEV